MRDGICGDWSACLWKINVTFHDVISNVVLYTQSTHTRETQTHTLVCATHFHNGSGLLLMRGDSVLTWGMSSHRLSHTPTNECCLRHFMCITVFMWSVCVCVCLCVCVCVGYPSRFGGFCGGWWFCSCLYGKTIYVSLSPLCLCFDVLLAHPFYPRNIYKDTREKSCLTMRGWLWWNWTCELLSKSWPSYKTFFPLHVLSSHSPPLFFPFMFSYAHFRSEICSQTKQFSKTSE